MDVLVALGTDASYFYSVISILHHRFVRHDAMHYTPTVRLYYQWITLSDTHACWCRCSLSLDQPSARKVAFRAGHVCPAWGRQKVLSQSGLVLLTEMVQSAAASGSRQLFKCQSSDQTAAINSGVTHSPDMQLEQ